MIGRVGLPLVLMLMVSPASGSAAPPAPVLTLEDQSLIADFRIRVEQGKPTDREVAASRIVRESSNGTSNLIELTEASYAELLAGTLQTSWTVDYGRDDAGAWAGRRRDVVKCSVPGNVNLSDPGIMREHGCKELTIFYRVLGGKLDVRLIDGLPRPIGPAPSSVGHR